MFQALVEGRTLRVEVKGSGERYEVTVDGRRLELYWHETDRGFVSVRLDGVSVELGLERRGSADVVVFPDDRVEVELSDAFAVLPGKQPAAGQARLKAPMPGRIVRVLAAPGAEVQVGQGLIVMEAMKMENEIRSPRTGRVQEIAVRDGQAVEMGALLAVVG